MNQTQEQEPSNWVVDESAGGNLTMSWMLALPMAIGTKLYTAPPQSKWQALTDEEIEQIVDAHWNDPSMFVEAIEATLKAKNEIPSP